MAYAYDSNPAVESNRQAAMKSFTALPVWFIVPLSRELNYRVHESAN